MIRIADLDIPLEYDEKTLYIISAEVLGVHADSLKSLKIIKKAINTSDHENIQFKITLCVEVTCDEDDILFQRKNKAITRGIHRNYILPNKKLILRPIIIGSGPAGLFAGLILARAGTNPIILERGKDIDSRSLSVSHFWETGILETNSNVQFGEGGAGAFSDGKLKIGMKDARKEMILREFVNAGAPDEILYLEKPHIGTDCLKDVVKNIRTKIISLGGEVRFGCRVTKILSKDGKVVAVGIIENNSYKEISTENVVLAPGNSARDTYKSLFDDGIIMEPRSISVGLRIEHPQDLINKLKFKEFANNRILGPADYRMTVHLPNGRGVYTFCMCPGGMVVSAGSLDYGIVTNGMSLQSRNGRNANSSLLVTVGADDFLRNIFRSETKANNKSEEPDSEKIADFLNAFPGIGFQNSIEESAYIAGGENYYAPVQRLEDFMSRKNSNSFGDVLPTYLPGTNFMQAESYLPEEITASLRMAIIEMNKWMPGFLFPDAILTGPETRSSSPVRIVRGDDLQAPGLSGLFPCGEGAGYSGGIISAAVDGVLCAEKILTPLDCKS